MSMERYRDRAHVATNFVSILKGATIRIANAHCGDGNRYIVRADEKLTAFLELESAVQAAS